MLTILALGMLCGAEASAETPEAPPLHVGGSMRARYESLSGQFRAGLNGDDQLITTRTDIKAEWRFRHARIGAELMDSRQALGDEGGSVGTGEVNALEMVEAYAAFGDFDGAEKARIELGRFTMDIGSRRLVERNNFGNTTNAFAGARFDWSDAAGHEAIVFYVLPQIRSPDDKPSILDNEVEFDEANEALTFAGAFFSTPTLLSDAKAEIFLYALNEADKPDRQTRNRTLMTAGVRLYRNPDVGAWDFELEGGLQRGHARATTDPTDGADLDVRAGYLHVGAGYTWEADWSPRLFLAYDLATGDARDDDAKQGRFDNLFGARRGDFGPTAIFGPFGRANISSPTLRLEVSPNERWDAMAALHVGWLDEARDAFASTGVRDPTGASGTFAGYAPEVRVQYWITPRTLRLEAGGAAVINGEFLKRAPNRTGEGDTLYGYTELTLSF